MKAALAALALVAALPGQAQAAYWGKTPETRAVVIQAAVAFAATSCKVVFADFRAVETAIRAQDVDPKDVDEGGRLFPKTIAMLEWFQKRPDQKEACINTYRMFGPRGEAVPGLLFIKQQ